MPATRGTRPAAVCQNCHRRKIKCDLQRDGSPCTKCKENGDLCEIRERKAYKPRKRRTLPGQAFLTPQSVSGEHSNQSPSTVDRSASPADDSDDSDGGERDLVLASTYENTKPSGDTAPLWVGDQQGIGAIFDTTTSTASSKSKANQKRHFMIPRAAAKALQVEDLEYLKAKGCFSLPRTEVCIALIEAYLKFVHPLFPVIDVHEFLGRYEKHGVQQINLLLLWSMFSVSASYISDPMLKIAGYATRKAFKESIIRRAKLLFDLSCENDKIVLIQASLLMSFWFADAEDVKQSWYWTGIAISVSQTIGLHRDPDGKKRNEALSDGQRRSWRNIWWGCVMRDAWLALGMGRPTRVFLEDCDCPMPTSLDAESNFREVCFDGKDVYGTDSAAFAGLWLQLLGVSEGLHKLLKKRYSGNPSESQIEVLRTELAPLFSGPPTADTTNTILKVATRHLHLYRHAATIALFRPDKDQLAVSTVQNAALAVNTILENSMADGTAVYASPRMIPLVVPAMYTHLMASRSKDDMKAGLGRHRLDFCLLFLKGLTGNYPAAEIVRRLFITARDAGGKKEKTKSAAPMKGDHPVPDYSPNTLDFGLFDTSEEPSSTDLSPSGFTLLPMQDQLFNMGIDGMDPNTFSMNFELSNTPDLMYSNNYSDFVDGFLGP